MFYKVRNATYILFLILFLSFNFFYYFSEENRNRINKNRSSSSKNFSEIVQNIPILKNDTSNVLEYPSSQSSEEKIKKRFFWDLLKTKNE